MGCMAIKHRGISSLDLARVVQDDDLSKEGLCSLGGIVLAVSTHVSTTDVLDRHVLDVETNVVTRAGLFHSGVMHLHGLDLSCHHGWGEGHHHTGLDLTSLHTTNGDRSDTSYLVDILEW